MNHPSDLESHLKCLFSSEGGRMSVEKFMEHALYDREFGYYTANIVGVGGRGTDFMTWANRPELGEGIAGWILGEMRQFDWKKGTVIEVGGGDGSLAQRILESLGWMGRRRINYHIVEISGPLRQIQQDRLKRKGVRWHNDMVSALRSCGHSALVLSNELVDAFPARWLRWNGKWEEIFVAYSPEKGLKEVFLPCDFEPGFLSGSIEPGQRVEVHHSYRKWLENWCPLFHEGALLTIDYGSRTRDSIYERSLAGTMRGYFRQNRIERGGIYERFGKQDLTCDVCFGDLLLWGDGLDLTTLRLESQLSFLERQGLCLAGGLEVAAEAFQVLHQRKHLQIKESG